MFRNDWPVPAARRASSGAIIRMAVNSVNSVQFRGFPAIWIGFRSSRHGNHQIPGRSVLGWRVPEGAIPT